jgi:hypothetical protein
MNTGTLLGDTRTSANAFCQMSGIPYSSMMFISACTLKIENTQSLLA